jgi:hypothetical protein
MKAALRAGDVQIERRSADVRFCRIAGAACSHAYALSCMPLKSARLSTQLAKAIEVLRTGRNRMMKGSFTYMQRIASAAYQMPARS